MSSDLRKKVLCPPPSSFPPRSVPDGSGPKGPRRRDFTPHRWDGFFDQKKLVETTRLHMNVYSSGTEGPIILMLHGGGYAGLTWALVAKHLSMLIRCRIFAPDLRGHGETTSDDDYLLSLEDQVEDVKSLVQSLFGDDKSPVFVVGHSMGGAVAVHSALALSPSHPILGLAVIDVVEGSALEALQGMQTLLKNRPHLFKSPEAAIEWCMKTGQTRNIEAARISMPSQIVPTKAVAGLAEDDLSEELEDKAEESSADQQSSGATTSYRWRIDLSKTECFWNGWFKGLSGKFLEVSAPKLLLLAGVDRLDKDLTIGQMSGKFQMVVLPRVGHCVQEDSPDRFAEVIASFCVRNRLAVALSKEFQPVFPGC